MQQDLPVESEPFVAVAGRLGVTVEELRRISDAMRAEGRLRRFVAVLRHREAGFGANGMGIWIARGGDAEIEAAGETMATFRAVTHCYRRPTYPDWPYNLFTMIHARSRGECESVVAAMARETGIAERAVLYSTHEYKKQRVEYFTEAEARWEAEASSQ
jgi:DNA-binding Lrp family transcriptional regulator